MEKQQELEWEAAQSTEINVDLVSAAKTQLKFLAAIDRNRWLYEGPGLDRAIYRQESDRPLVIPLDCEWVWHCHRLNPVRYKLDCEEFYGRILDNQNVISSLEGISSRPTEDIWKTLFPGEPYELDFESVHQDNMSCQRVVGENCTKYDLISAVQRQGPFFYQVSRLHMNDNRYIEGSVARYKGFLHLIKRNKEKGIKSFSVPTYDIDLIWHTHQLHPVSYCEDLVKIMGKILEHDDTDSDRTKGQKLDVGFSGTTKTFEDMYGRRYWRAGAMYKGSAPSPVRLTPYSGTIMKKVPIFDESPKLAPPTIKVFEVIHKDLYHTRRIDMVPFSKNWARIVDDDGNMVLNLQMRDLQKSKGKKECRRRVVVGVMDSGKTCTLAEFAESKWSMVNSPWSLKLPNANNDDGHLLEMTGPHAVRLFPGGRLDYESRRCAKHKADCQYESHLITAVKFSAEEPYGTAVASLDMKSGTVKVF
ncbi:DNA-binding protein [Perilla frutescens var. frutescens]|nr:DNA-binding protein [Perilla frutescens var. frutescens]